MQIKCSKLIASGPDWALYCALEPGHDGFCNSTAPIKKPTPLETETLEIDAIRAAAKQHGLLLVPVEPSDEALQAGVDAACDEVGLGVGDIQIQRAAFKAVVAATVEGG